MAKIIETNSEQQTYDLGVRIGQKARAGDVFTLVGDLGDGEDGVYQRAGVGPWH